MPLKSLEDAFLDELRDLLSAERQLTKALPKMAKGASSAPLKEAFEHHLQETERQVERLEKVFESLGKSARAKRCDAMEGLVEEGKELLEHEAEPAVMDALLIASAQKVEHYEIASYGTLCTWAEMLGYREAVRLLKETMSEEVQADEKLTKLSQQINQAAIA
jgi:ferritin-like metal-binding protein YciE